MEEVPMLWFLTKNVQSDVNSTDVDGRDFLVWQRGNATDGEDWTVIVVTDHGHVGLPAVQKDDDYASITDGTSNTVLGDGSVRFLHDSIDLYV